jgi:hypothetical protein
MGRDSPYNALLHEICVDLGFCGSVVDGEPLHVDKFIPDKGTVSADQFVDWVFMAEGWDPSEADASKHRASIRNAFVTQMGAEAVDAGDLKWP